MDELDAHAYCTVRENEKVVIRDTNYWRTTCIDGVIIYFTRKIRIGETVQYVPYHEDGDLSTLYGHIQRANVYP